MKEHLEQLKAQALEALEKAANNEELEALRAEAKPADPAKDPAQDPDPKNEGPDVKSVLQDAQIAMAASSAL